MEKKCNVCQESRPLTDFYAAKKSPDGYDYTCKPCSRARARKWNTDHPDRVLENQRKSWANRAAEINAKRRVRNVADAAYQAKRAEQRRRYYAKNRELEAVRSKARRETEAFKAWNAEYQLRTADQRRTATIKRKYGITSDEYDAMVDEQDGVCAICKREMPLTVDHDHSCCDSDASCGRCVRGLLCNPCNRALGFFGDDLERLRSAVQYLSYLDVPECERPPKTAVEAAVWAEWNSISDDEPSPVKRIAKNLNMTAADVAFIVYPAETFGRWEDDHEEDV